MTPSMIDARRRALLAAARVTLSLSALGCKSEPAKPTSSYPATSDVVAGDLNGPALACGLPARPPHTSERVDCCEARVLGLAPAWSKWGLLPPELPGEVDAATMACCQAIITAYDTNLRTRARSPEHTNAQAACCHYVMRAEGLPFRGPTCTPWGPPMPPAMPAWISDEKGAA